MWFLSLFVDINTIKIYCKNIKSTHEKVKKQITIKWLKQIDIIIIIIAAQFHTTCRDITILPSFVRVHGVAPGVIVTIRVQISAVVGVVEQGLVRGVGVRRLFGPRLTRSSRSCHVGSSFILPTATRRQTLSEFVDWKQNKRKLWICRDIIFSNIRYLSKRIKENLSVW